MPKFVCTCVRMSKDVGSIQARSGLVVRSGLFNVGMASIGKGSSHLWE